MLLLALGACTTPDVVRQVLPHRPVAQAAVEPEDVPDDTQAGVVTDDGSDWVRLVSGEWSKGADLTFDRGTLEFDSDELGTLKIDWDDVAEIRTAREFTIVLEGPVEAVGELRMVEDELFLTGADGTRAYRRKDVFRFVPGQPSEANYWSGKLALTATARSGNVDQVDFSSLVSVLRRTARSRLPLSYEAAYGELEGERSANNQRFLGRYDRFLGSDLFLTPLGIEVYRDAFQNIDLRVAPYTGLGYTLKDTARVEWGVTGGLGYRYTRYDSVEAGEDGSDETAMGILGSTLAWEPSGSVDVNLSYQAQIGFEDTTDTNQSARIEVFVDLWWDFDLAVRLGWDRVGDPQADSDGNTPQRDDFRASVGLAWSF
jgi:hypothetical protein